MIQTQQLITSILNESNSHKEFLTLLNKAFKAHNIKDSVKDILSQYIFDNFKKSKLGQLPFEFKNFDFLRERDFISGMREIFTANKIGDPSRLYEILEDAKLFYFCRAMNIPKSSKEYSILQEMRAPLITPSKCPFAKSIVNNNQNNPEPLLCERLTFEEKEFFIGEIEKFEAITSPPSGLLIIKDLEREISRDCVVVLDGDFTRYGWQTFQTYLAEVSRIYCTEWSQFPCPENYGPTELRRRFKLGPADLIYTGLCKGMTPKGRQNRILMVGSYLISAMGIQNGLERIITFIDCQLEYSGPSKLQLILEESRNKPQLSADQFLSHISQKYPDMLEGV